MEQFYSKFILKGKEEIGEWMRKRKKLSEAGSYVKRKWSEFVCCKNFKTDNGGRNDTFQYSKL